MLGGGATAGAFEVGVIEVLARRGIVPDRLLELWLWSNRSIMFPDGPAADGGPRRTRI